MYISCDILFVVCSYPLPMTSVILGAKPNYDKHNSCAKFSATKNLCVETRHGKGCPGQPRPCAQPIRSL